MAEANPEDAEKQQGLDIASVIGAASSVVVEVGDSVVQTGKKNVAVHVNSTNITNATCYVVNIHSIGVEQTEEQFANVKDQASHDKEAEVDYLDRSLYAKSLADVLHDIETPFTLGVFGRYGSGKSSLISIVRDQLKIKEENDRREQKVEKQEYDSKNQENTHPLSVRFSFALLLSFFHALFCFINPLQIYQACTPDPNANEFNSSDTCIDQINTVSDIFHSIYHYIFCCILAFLMYAFQFSAYYRPIHIFKIFNSFLIVEFVSFFALQYTCHLTIQSIKFPCLSKTYKCDEFEALFCIYPFVFMETTFLMAFFYFTNQKTVLLCFYAAFSHLPISSSSKTSEKNSYPTSANDDDNSPSLSRRYIFVNFSSWNYAGSDNLWAGIIENILKEVEHEFGSNVVHVFRSLQIIENPSSAVEERLWHHLWNHAIKSFLLPKYVWCVVYFLTLSYGIPFTIDLISQVDCTGCFHVFTLYWIMSVMALLGPLFIHFISHLYKKVGDLILTVTMKNKLHSMNLGFMKIIKEEVATMTKLINTAKVTHGLDYKIVLSIDDIDRISAEKITALIEAVYILLSEPSSPFICILAVDSLLASTSIEKVKTMEGLSGHEYLKKIINLPFCVPTLKLDSMKKNYVYYLITATNLRRQLKGKDRIKLTDVNFMDKEGRSAGASYDQRPQETARMKVDKGIEFPVLCRALKLHSSTLFLKNNPREIKRIYNIVTLAANICVRFKDHSKSFKYNLDEKFAQDLVDWVILAEQWPVAACFILKHARRNNSDNGRRNSSDNGRRNSSDNGRRNSSDNGRRNSSDNGRRNSSDNGRRNSSDNGRRNSSAEQIFRNLLSHPDKQKYEKLCDVIGEDSKNLLKFLQNINIKAKKMVFLAAVTTVINDSLYYRVEKETV